MRILFDQGTPVSLRLQLAHHEVATAFELGWARLTNGQLLRAAEDSGFEVFVTTDTNMKYQQNLAGRRIAVIVLTTPSWPRIQRVAATICAAVDGAVPESYCEVVIP